MPCERPRRIIGAYAATLWLLAGISPQANAAVPAAQAQTFASCTPSNGLSYVCGPVASEDLARVPATGWLIASGMNVGAPAHLYLIDSRAKTAAIAFPVDARHLPTKSRSGCEPPDTRRMSLDGLALRPGPHRLHILYAANHGDRSAIEIFTVDARGPRPRIQWRDCAALPPTTLPNAVAILPGEDFLVISFYDPTDAQAWARMARGEPTGRILRWHAGAGFADVAGGTTSGGNGLETSIDGQTAYASAWSARRVVVLSLRDGSRREIPLDFMPDNLHRLADGTLLVGGQRTSVDAIHACGPQCPQPWVIARVDPRTAAVQELLTGPGTQALNYACGAVAIDGTLFVTVRGDRRIAYRTLTGLQALH